MSLNPRQFGNQVPEGTNIERSGGKGHIEGDESRSVTKMVPISTVKRYREYDREGKQSHGSLSEETINNITNELKSGGVIKTPLAIYHLSLIHI